MEKRAAGLCDSKASGTPYLPHDTSWPLDGANQPMELLAQIDCSALESLPDFPHTGLLQFFIGTDECYGADFDDMTNQKGFCVLYHEVVDVSVTEEEVLEKRPEKSDEEDVCTPFETEKPCRIHFAAPKSMKLTEGNFHFDGLFVEEWNRCRPDAPIEKTSEIHQRLKKKTRTMGGMCLILRKGARMGKMMTSRFATRWAVTLILPNMIHGAMIKCRIST